MKYIVAYDIKNDRVRVKVSRLLTEYGYRIQLSVFYLPALSEEELNKLYLDIKKLINPRTDRVFFYPVESIEVFEGYPIEPWEIEVM